MENKEASQLKNLKRDLDDDKDESSEQMELPQMSTERGLQEKLSEKELQVELKSSNSYNSSSTSGANVKPQQDNSTAELLSRYDQGALKCVAILPGIGFCTETSDSEISSTSDDEPILCSSHDLCGRKIKQRRNHRHYKISV